MATDYLIKDREDDDDWFYKSIRKYEYLGMFQLDVGWTPICMDIDHKSHRIVFGMVRSDDPKGPKRLLIHRMPLKVVATDSERDLCNDRDLGYFSGGDIGTEELKAVKIFGPNCVISAREECIQVWEVSGGSDLLKMRIESQIKNRTKGLKDVPFGYPKTLIKARKLDKFAVLSNQSTLEYFHVELDKAGNFEDLAELKSFSLFGGDPDKINDRDVVLKWIEDPDCPFDPFEVHGTARYALAQKIFGTDIEDWDVDKVRWALDYTIGVAVVVITRDGGKLHLHFAHRRPDGKDFKITKILLEQESVDFIKLSADLTDKKNLCLRSVLVCKNEAICFQGWDGDFRKTFEHDGHLLPIKVVAMYKKNPKVVISVDESGHCQMWSPSKPS